MVYDKSYYERNKEKCKARARKYRKENPEKHATACKNWRENHRERYNHIANEYKKTYRKQCNAHQREWLRKLKGQAKRGNKCMLCYSTERLEFHHEDYNKDKGFTLCHICHKRLHNGKLNLLH